MRNIYLYFFLLILSGLFIGWSITHWSAEYTFYFMIGCILGALTFARPELGLFFMLLSCLFLSEIPIGVVGAGMTKASREIGIRPDDLLTGLIPVGWFAHLVLRRESPTIPHSPLHWPIIIVSVIFILSTLIGVLNDTVSASTGFFFTLKKLQYFLVFFMVISIFSTLNQVKTAVVVLLVASGLVASWGIIEHVILPLARVSGPFQRNQANVLGGFFLITMFITLSFLFNYPHWWFRLRLIVLLVLSISVVAFTRSRSTYVSLFIGLFIFSILSRRFWFIVIPILLLLLTPIIFPTRVQEAVYSVEKVLKPRVLSDPSWVSRVNAWEAALGRIYKKPFFGYGLGSHDLAWPDNQYVLDALSVGLIGLVAFIWLLIRLLRTLGQMSRDSPNLYTRTLALGFLVGLIALLIQGIAIANFYTIRIAMTFWFVAGLVMVIRHIEESAVPAQTIGTEGEKSKTPTGGQVFETT